MTELICKAIVNAKGDVSFESADATGLTIPQIIEYDKKYGVMKPRNGKYFTFKALDWQNKWITDKQITKGIGIAWNMVEKIISIDVREAKEGEEIDFKIYFRNTADDPKLSKNTLMYQYYPISNVTSPNRGVCVVNTDFAWTTHGEGIALHLFDPVHYTTPTDSTVRTYDFDATYQHEGPGHGMGLPHSPNPGKKMSSTYGTMVESIFDETDDETILRLQAKYPKRDMSLRRLARWIKYYFVRRDKY